MSIIQSGLGLLSFTKYAIPLSDHSSSNDDAPLVGICGAGAVGCFIGSKLLEAGVRVLFYGRESIKNDLEKHGITSITEVSSKTIPPSKIIYGTDLKHLSDCSYIFITVKCTSTDEIAEGLSKVLHRKTKILSFQNGLQNATALKKHLPEHEILSAVVPFSVSYISPGQIYADNNCKLVIESSEFSNSVIENLFSKTDLKIELTKYIEFEKWAKLMFNLNNGINTISDLPLNEELKIYDYRQLWARCILEGLMCMKLIGVEYPTIKGIYLKYLPYLLLLPNYIFIPLLKNLKIRKSVRSSMMGDLQKGKKTEIDFLNGEIVRLAEILKIDAKHNSYVCQQIEKLENVK